MKEPNYNKGKHHASKQARNSKIYAQHIQTQLSTLRAQSISIPNDTLMTCVPILKKSLANLVSNTVLVLNKNL